MPALPIRVAGMRVPRFNSRFISLPPAGKRLPILLSYFQMIM
jgi:hypothetical protein